jgi:hypothetical protein
MRARFAGCLMILLAAPSAARADDTEDLCIAASLEGQVLRRNNRLEKAHERFADCAIAACVPAGTQAKCAAWAAEVEPLIPRVAIQVVDDRSAALPRAEVLLDGARVPIARDVAVDPGHHGLQATYLGRSTRLDFDVQAGERRNARLVIDLRRVVRERPVPAWTLGLGAAAAVGTVAFALFGNLTLARERDLDACKPYCDPADRPRLVTYAAIADVSLILAAGTAVGALVTYFARPTREHVERITPESSP